MPSGVIPYFKIKRNKTKNRPLAIFDIDGTIFRSSLLIELNWALIKNNIFPKKVLPELDNAYFSWMDRKASYQHYLNKVIEIFDYHIKGVKVKDVERISNSLLKKQKNRVYRFTRQLIKRLRKTHYLLAISGSPIEMVKKFAKMKQFDFILATERKIKNGRYTQGRVSNPAVNKKKYLQEFVSAHNLSFKNSVGIGDSEDDIGIFKLVEYPICFNPTKKLYRIARRVGWPIYVERKNVIYRIQ